MRNCILMVIFVSLFLMSGCAMFEGNITQSAQEASIIFSEKVEVDEQATLLIEEGFLDSDVPWDEEMVKKINKARMALVSEGEFLQGRLNIDGTLKYYNYRAGFERVTVYVSALITELNARCKIEGAIAEDRLWIYEAVRDDTLDRLDEQRIKIAKTEKSIQEKASKDTIEDMKNIYNTLKPLVGMVL